MPKQKTDVILKQWEWQCVEVMHYLLREHDEINADLFAAECRKREIPAPVISAQCPRLFRSYRSQGYLINTGTFVRSERRSLDSSPLPVYRVSPRFKDKNKDT